MPMDRIDVNSTVGAPSFNSRGAVNEYNPNKRGPDLGRLMNAFDGLVKGGKRSSNEEAKKEADEAEYEVRSVILSESKIKDGESQEDRRRRIDAAISEVRNKWATRDRSFLSTMFHEEDPALRVVDAVHADQKALDLRNTLTNLRVQNPHMTTQQFMQSADKIMEGGFAEISHLSAEHKKNFLKQVNDHTLNEIHAMSGQAEARIEKERLQENFSTAFAMTEDTLCRTLGVTPDQASKSLESFQEFHSNWDKNSSQIVDGVAQGTLQVYRNALAMSHGDKVKASSEAFKYATAIAERTGRPEILDAVKKLPLGDGTDGRTLNKFHAKEISDAQHNIEIQRAKTQNYLVNKQASMNAAKNKAHFDSISLSVDKMILPAVRSQDPDQVEEAFGSLQTQQKSLLKQINSGQFKGNEEQAQKVLKYLYASEKMLISEKGTPEARAALVRGLDEGTWSVQDHNYWAPKLSPSDKNASFETIKPELEADDEARADIRLDRKNKSASIVQNPIDDIMTKWDLFVGTNKSTIEFMNKSSDEFPAVLDSKIIRDRLSSQLLEARGNLRDRIYKAEGRAPTPEEIKETIKPILDNAKETLKSESDRILKAEGTAGYKEISDSESAVRKDYDKVAGKLRSGEATSDEEIDKWREGVLKGAPSSVQEVQSALVNRLRNKGEFKRLPDILRTITKDATFDLKKPDHKQLLRTVLERGLQDTPYSYRVGTKIVDGQPVYELVTRDSGSLGGIDKFNLGDILSKALEDNKLITRKQLKEFYKEYPFGTMPTPNIYTQGAQQEWDRRINAEIDEIMEIWGASQGKEPDKEPIAQQIFNPDKNKEKPKR